MLDIITVGLDLAKDMFQGDCQVDHGFASG